MSKRKQIMKANENMIKQEKLELSQDQDSLEDMMDSEDMVDQHPKQKGSAGKSKARHDNSLSVLTKKFVKLIRGSPDHTIDLNDAVRELQVQKRRIYDITNVLEGIGYIEKISKNKIKWVGATDDPELESEVKGLRTEYEEMQDEERTIDHWIDHLQTTLQNSYLNNPDIARYTYLTYEDIKELSKIQQSENKGDALFIITAPKGTSVEAPISDNSNTEYPYQLYLNSSKVQNGGGQGGPCNEISVYICSDQNNPIEYEKKQK